MNLLKNLRTGILLSALAANCAHAQPRELHLALRTRDPKTNQVVIRTEDLASAKVAVVIVDPWNFHWCMTACERVSAMVPRWNRAVDCARKLGMPILWAPSDVAGNYAGYSQRERALAVPLASVPKMCEMPPAHFTAPGGGCMCGPGIHCVVNYGWDGMNPDLILADDDLIVSSTAEVYSLLHQRGITHVIYMGLHTNMCLFGKPGALKYMVQAGLKCMLARDINDAITAYNPATGFTPDKGTQQTDDDLERAGVPTINVVDEWRRTGVWNDRWIVETVRIAPWGKRLRPYFFEGSTLVTLTTPLLEKVQIRYTLDGSEPGPNSPRYEKPIQLTETTELRTAAFRDDERVSVPTNAYFARLPAKPPKPDVYLDELKDVVDPYAHNGPECAAFLLMPKVGKSFGGQPLRIRERTYAKGLGFRAPGGVRYELKPEYDRFVGLAGIADDVLNQVPMGRNVAMRCSVVFRVFLDGKIAAESPVMRISQEPWRFDVQIPPGSRFIRLVCVDAGSRNVLDLGNWVESGFVRKKALLTVVALAAGAVTAQGPDQELASEMSDVLLFDTGAALTGELSSAALAEKADWVKVEKEAAPGQFKGDMVFLNGRIAVVLRKSAAGAEIYSNSAKGWQRRALLAPAKTEKVARLRAVKILANDPDVASVEGVFEGTGGESLGLRCGLTRGQIFVETRPGEGANRVRIEAPSRFGVIPDLFADDIVIDAARLPLDQAEIPTENMFLQTLGRTEAIMMAVWDKEQRDITVTLSGRDNDRLLTAVEVPCATDGKVCVAVMDYPGACCASVIDGLADPEVPIRAQAMKDVRALGWTMPYPAQWRVDFAPKKGGMARSSEMVAPYPVKGAGSVMKSPRDIEWKFIKPKYRWLSDGEKAEDRARRFEAAQAFRKTGGEELPASVGTCWVDEKGNGFVRPKNEEYAVVAYPLDRGRGTPLTAFTVTDLVRATLGVGPCEYILDVKGQRLATPGVYTCAGTALLKKIMENYDEAKHKAEIDKVFNDMLIFVRHYRGRVEEYIAFRKEMLDYLKQQKAAHPELETFLSDMERITSGLPSRIEKDVPDRVAKLADEFRGTLASQDDAAKKARERINADIRGAGGYQDGIVNGCRKTLNMLRYMAGIEATCNPKAVGVAQEIRLRARKILRNPVAHEFDEGRPW